MLSTEKHMHYNRFNCKRENWTQFQDYHLPSKSNNLWAYPFAFNTISIFVWIFCFSQKILLKRRRKNTVLTFFFAFVKSWILLSNRVQNLKNDLFFNMQSSNNFFCFGVIQKNSTVTHYVCDQWINGIWHSLSNI